MNMTRLVPLMLAMTVSTSMTRPGSQATSDLRKSVEQRVTVFENKTIFTLFDFLNLAGYDSENDSAGMHPVRNRVRQTESASPLLGLA